MPTELDEAAPHGRRTLALLLFTLLLAALFVDQVIADAAFLERPEPQAIPLTGSPSPR